MQPGRNGRPGFEEPSIAGRPGQAGRPVVLNHPSFTSVVPMEKDLSANTEGSGSIAQDHSVAAGAGGVAVGRDVHGDVTVVNITYQGSEIAIPSPEARQIRTHAFVSKPSRDLPFFDGQTQESERQEHGVE